MVRGNGSDIEVQRLQEDAERKRNWKRWGPYLSERQWATVREDYSREGDCWVYFPHDHARSRVYRWGEDGLLGICDRECRLCFAVALWNGRDPFLKERLFGLTGPEGNHGEDVKEYYFYLDSTPTHSYMKALYRYPQAPFPYQLLLDENRRRGRDEPEFELLDTGVFEGDRFFDVFAEYAKESPNDILIRLTIVNRGPQAAPIHLLPTLWFRNTWSWGRRGEAYWSKPAIEQLHESGIVARHPSLGDFRFEAEASEGFAGCLFTENDTNFARLYGVPNRSPFVKDGFNDYVVGRKAEAVNPGCTGTKSAAYYRLQIPANGSVSVRLRLFAEEETPLGVFGPSFDRILEKRIQEADSFYAARIPKTLTADEQRIQREASAGLLWTKQFYHYVIDDWLEGDPSHPPPSRTPATTRNADWSHLYNRDVMSVPDKWEYPWFAAWDLAFHMIPFAKLDPYFAKEQLTLLLREWYMHPNGQIPAYEFAFSDVNPPVHAWACWRVYKMTGPRGHRDTLFLERVFQKLLLNFTWWVNRKDVTGKHIFAGGFLGLDNIGLFDRSRPVPTGGQLEQADGTAWMAFYCTTMLAIAIDLAQENSAYEDAATKFFEHFVAIADAMNRLGGTGLWNEEDGFYYDQLMLAGNHVPLRIRSMVGIIPLFAVEVLEKEEIGQLHGFRKRLNWFLENRRDLASQISYMDTKDHEKRYLLAIPSRTRLVRLLRYLLDESEFLSPYGIRSVSRAYQSNPYIFRSDSQEYRVEYVPGESNSGLFGGNSNWRGPIWFPMNYLIIEALERYHHFYHDSLKVECPTGSGRMLNLLEVSQEIAVRLSRLFLARESGGRPCHGGDRRFSEDPHWRDLLLFYEYFHGENGRGLGASHQTGWTSLIVPCLDNVAKTRLAAGR
jgi:Mannosylglycerate hydrolase MGH1-like glycoside hydrolase domain